MDVQWHIHANGVTSVADESLVQEMIRDRSLLSSDLVWREGANGWKPAGDVFPDMYYPQGDRSSGRSRKTLLLAWFAFLIASNVPVAGYFVAEDTSVGSILSRNPFLQIVLFSLSSVAAGFLLAFVFRRRLGSLRRGAYGAALALAIPMYMTNLIITTSLIFRLNEVLDVDRAIFDMSYSLTVDNTNNSVHLNGLIGKDLFERLREIDGKLGGIDTFVITSHGGAVSEALLVADFLARRELKVVVRGHCDSACVLLAISSPHSYAEAGMKFGLHEVSPIISSSSELIQFAIVELQRRVDEYMRSKGVPDYLIRVARYTPHDELFYVSAEVLVSLGVIKGLVEVEAAPHLSVPLSPD